jgi:NADH:ubiquinone reductase (H+-translocating)
MATPHIMTTPHIVVLGAGYTGLNSAKLVAKRTGATVTLVNNRDRFVERMRNHQLATGQKLREMPLSDLVKGTGIRLTVDQVTRISPERRQVELARGEPVDYDLLVNALGSYADLDGVPGAAEHALGIGNAEQAEHLRDRMGTASTVAVVGAGLTGIEVVTELAETYPDKTVRLTTAGALGDFLSGGGQEYLHRTLDRLGIQVWEHAHVAKVAADGLLLEDGEHVGADAVAWTAGFTVSPLAREAGLAVDDNGRMVVDETMRSVSHPEVYGIGDAGAGRDKNGKVMRMGCGPGGWAGVAAVTAITARLAGRTPRVLRFPDSTSVWCISLGRRDGLIDTPGDKPKFTGRLAAMVKEGVVRGAAYGQRRPVLAELAARQY